MADETLDPVEVQETVEVQEPIGGGEAAEEKKAPPKKPSKLITQANEAAERLENANKELKELLARQETKVKELLTRQETMLVEETLAGTASAGAQKETPEEKSIGEAKKLLEGTGYEDLFDDPK